MIIFLLKIIDFFVKILYNIYRRRDSTRCGMLLKFFINASLTVKQRCVFFVVYFSYNNHYGYK